MRREQDLGVSGVLEEVGLHKRKGAECKRDPQADRKGGEQVAPRSASKAAVSEVNKVKERLSSD